MNRRGNADRIEKLTLQFEERVSKGPFGSAMHSRVHHQKIECALANVHSFKICLAHIE